MKSDALFQLGMGPVELDATQTEDHSRLRSARIRDVRLHEFRVRAGLIADAILLRFTIHLRGNSAKALIVSA